MPPEQIIPEDKTQQSVSAEDYRMLLDSETTAIIVGLRLAGFPAEVNNTGVRITSVLPDSPATGILQPDDIITNVSGVSVVTPADLTSKIRQLTAQTILKMNILRGGNTLSLDVPTMEPQPADGAVKIGITIEQYSSGYTLPFPVKIVAEKVSGGPSAGLMFTLGVYDLLTEKDLTGGRKIAGTGTIDLEGNVGPIGGVQQKVAAAERAGAEYFFSPMENYADAVSAARHIKVIKVRTAQEAIDFLQGL
jgi:PDZ domain-containing protein